MDISNTAGGNWLTDRPLQRGEKQGRHWETELTNQKCLTNGTIYLTLPKLFVVRIQFLEFMDVYRAVCDKNCWHWQRQRQRTKKRKRTWRIDFQWTQHHTASLIILHQLHFNHHNRRLSLITFCTHTTRHGGDPHWPDSPDATSPILAKREKWKISLSQKKLKTQKCELTGKVSKEKERILKKEFL